MRDFPSCFGENGVQVANSSNKNAQNMVACVYQTSVNGLSFTVTVTWNKCLMGQGFIIDIDDCRDQSICKVDIKPWLFSKNKGSKSLDAATSGKSKVEIFWDLSSAKFVFGPEPSEGFYIAVMLNHEMILLLGDLSKEAHQKTKWSPPPSNVIFVSRREYLFGKRVYYTRAQFLENGQFHDITIECETARQKDPYFEIKIDNKRVMQVKHLRWKFRGNQTILVDGHPVEVCWDVYNWLFNTLLGNAVFMFQTCVSANKVLSLPCSQIFREKQLQGLVFSFTLYAWKNE